LKTPASIAIILVVVAAIVGLSATSAVREQRRLLDEFTVATHRQARASVDLLSARLDALDQDTRLLIDLVERSRANKELDIVTEQRIWTTAFQALATVVPQYRTICLFRADGTLEVRAGDPTENQLTIDALLPPSRRLAIAVSADGVKALARPATRYRDRSFLLYGTPVGGGGAVVVASDAAVFLGGMAWTPVPVARLFVTDPAGIVWAGCETTRGCRATDSETIQNALTSPVATISTIAPEVAEALGLGRTAVVRIAERIGRPTGSWTVTWLASSKAILDRERWRLFRLIATAMAAAVAVACVGVVLLRQQRKAVALESQLEYAQALASARETSAAIVENAPLGVLGVSQAGTVVLVNRFLADRLGSIRVGGPLEQAFSGEGGPWIREIAPLLLAAVAIDGIEGSPPELRSVSTNSHTFHVRVVPVRNHELGVRAFALVEDQSELRKLENQLLRAEKLVTVGILSAGIAHEIGSPLAVIRGRAEQVLRHVPVGSGAEDLRVIIKHIDHISSTIRQLLDFSRRQPIVRRAVALEAAVERARELLLWKLEAKGLEWRVAIDEDVPPLAADPDQLQQVLVNLLLNACDASEPGQQVSLTAQSARDGLVRLEVVDHGCGIAREHMNAVFDPFFTTKKRGEGTGLGLPVAASIVRNHAGEINLASTHGKGTTVTVLWPVLAQSVEVSAHA
jgi:signal transduction histidine kinase